MIAAILATRCQVCSKVPHRGRFRALYPKHVIGHFMLPACQKQIAVRTFVHPFRHLHHHPYR